MNIGEKIKALREQRRMTLEDVARALSVGRATIFKYETGKITNIASEKIEQMARLFSVSPAYLMGWEDSYEIDKRAIEEEKVINAYWNADPVYREIAVDILIQHPSKKEKDTMSAG